MGDTQELIFTKLELDLKLGADQYDDVGHASGLERSTVDFEEPAAFCWSSLYPGYNCTFKLLFDICPSRFLFLTRISLLPTNAPHKRAGIRALLRCTQCGFILGIKLLFCVNSIRPYIYLWVCGERYIHRTFFGSTEPRSRSPQRSPQLLFLWGAWGEFGYCYHRAPHSAPHTVFVSPTRQSSSVISVQLNPTDKDSPRTPRHSRTRTPRPCPCNIWAEATRVSDGS